MVHKIVNYYTKFQNNQEHFSNMVKASKSSPEDSETILKALMRIHAIKENNYSPTFMNMQDYGFEVITFSDSAVISCPAENDNLFFLILELIHLQIDLVPLGILLRGAITIGDLHHKRDIVFGPAMNDAYYLESKVAIYPRIILTESAIDQFYKFASTDEEIKQEFDSLILKDKDGYYFIDILRQDQEIDDPDMYLEWLSIFREIIINGLKYDDPAVRMKYQWLYSYFNDVIAEDPFALRQNSRKRKRYSSTPSSVTRTRRCISNS